MLNFLNKFLISFSLVFFSGGVLSEEHDTANASPQPPTFLPESDTGTNQATQPVVPEYIREMEAMRADNQTLQGVALLMNQGQENLREQKAILEYNRRLRDHLTEALNLARKNLAWAEDYLSNYEQHVADKMREEAQRRKAVLVERRQKQVDECKVVDPTQTAMHQYCTDVLNEIDANIARFDQLINNSTTR